MLVNENKLPFGRWERHSVLRGLTLSLLLHFLVFGSLELAYQLGWLQHSLISLALSEKKSPEELLVLQQQQSEEVPLLFIEVDPDRAAEESPPDAKYYSTQNSTATNPDQDLDSNIPKISGTQDKVPKLADTAPAPPQALQPSAPQKTEPEVAEETPAEPESPPEVKRPQGDLAVAKPNEGVDSKEEPVEKPQAPSKPVRVRPRRLAQVQPAENRIAGQKMKQEGGVKRFALDAAVDAKATPFGAYDAAIIAAIQKRWYDLLDDRSYALNASGRVVVTFRLNSDGRVTEMKVMENSVSEILALICQRAVQDPAPFPVWPSDMRRLVGADYREVRFTFYYN